MLPQPRIPDLALDAFQSQSAVWMAEDIDASLALPASPMPLGIGVIPEASPEVAAEILELGPALGGRKVDCTGGRHFS